MILKLLPIRYPVRFGNSFRFANSFRVGTENVDSVGNVGSIRNVKENRFGDNCQFVVDLVLLIIRVTKFDLLSPVYTMRRLMKNIDVREHAWKYEHAWTFSNNLQHWWTVFDNVERTSTRFDIIVGQLVSTKIKKKSHRVNEALRFYSLCENWQFVTISRMDNSPSGRKCRLA